MVLTHTAWPRRLLITVILAAVLVLRMPFGGSAAEDPGAQMVPVAAAAPGFVDNIKECASTPLGLLTGPLACAGAKSAGGAIKDAAGEGFKSMVKSMAQGWVKILQLTLAWFIKLPTPQYASDSVIQDIQKATVQIQLYGLIASILIGSWRLVMARRQAVMNEAQESFMGLAKTVFGAWMFGGVLTACTASSDALSNWLLEQGTKDNENLITNLAAANLLTLGSGLILIVAVCGILGGILQAVLLIGRQAMLAVVVAMIPLVGSFGGTTIGKMAFSRLVQWTIALLLWKPVAALVYWVAFKLAGHDVGSLKDAQMALMGLILLSLTVLVLPMLTKLISAGAAMSGGSGLQAGMMAAGAVTAAGTMVATGGASGAASAGSTAGGSTASMSGASMGSMGGPTGPSSGGLSGGTGSSGGPSGSGSGSGRGGTGSSGHVGRHGGGTGSGNPGDAGTAAGAGTGPQPSASPGAGSSGTGSVGVGNISQAASSAMSASQTLFDDNYESSSLVSEGAQYR
ncbi:MAG: hypothetical protein DI630_20010 [Gordonia sp. (in: high G+C Gram-positive bacteria)]|nr:MAG: hypothetical protein DI630_20010 [Gordonia sp. (in: high G+C Gram-positive bacteria)]